MRKLIYVVSLLLVVLGTVFALRQIGNSTTFQFFGEIVPRVEIDERLVRKSFNSLAAPPTFLKIIYFSKPN